MRSYLEVWGPRGPELVPLDGARLSVGSDEGNDLTLASDGAVSSLHAVLERYGPGWSIRDLDSRNGTFVNGERIWGERPLKPRDEIRVGRTRLIFRTEASAARPPTEGFEAAPELTRREREVLRALCRPLLAGDAFTEPASVKEIAVELFVTEAAVKNHLINLYPKFGIEEGSDSRRVRLANAAIRRGAVTLADLR